MKQRIVFGILYAIYACIILFVFCALPWYGVIVTSNWYLLLAIPLTVVGAVLSGEGWVLVLEEIDKADQDGFDWTSFFEDFDD